MNEASNLDTAPVNATDRNIKTAIGLFKGHITLPSAFLTVLIVVPNIAWLFVVHLCFEEVASIRQRLVNHERIIYGYIERTSPTTDSKPEQ